MATFEFDSWGGSGPMLHLAHANGFPPGTYRKLINALTPHFSVLTLRTRFMQPGTSPSEFTHWELMADDLIDSLRAAKLQNIVGVGHSMGAVATLIAASRAPELISRVIALDPVIFSLRDEALVRATQRLGISKFFPPASAARKRREVWPSRNEASLRYRDKPLFRDFDAECFADYLTFGMTDVPDGVRLTISRAWEAKVFETSPRDIWKSLSELKVPTTFVRGASSATFSAAAAARVRKMMPSARFTELPGAHLFPLEHPLETARFIIDV